MRGKLAVAAVTLAAAWVAATAAAQPIQLRETLMQFTPVGFSVGSFQPNPVSGNSFVTQGVLTRGFTTVGHTFAACTVVTATQTNCMVTMVMPQGKLLLAATTYPAVVNDRFAVVGGTGVYAQARGEASATSTVVLKLIRDSTTWTINLESGR